MINKDNSKEEVNYEDAEGWRGDKQGTLDIKQIVLRLYQKALLEGAKEMNTTGVIERLVGDQVVRTPAPNQVEIFVNSVKMTLQPLLPRLESCKNKYVKERYEEFKKELDNLDVKCSKRYDEIFIKPKQTSTIIPRINIEHKYDAERLSENNAQVSALKEWRWQKEFDIYLRALGTISFLLSDMNYFEERVEGFE